MSKHSKINTQGVLGTSDDSDRFLKNLDERKLVDLCADLLTVERHSEVVITDGPGDGQRDIHSKDAKGEKQLTQSKFHSNISQSVSAKELGEVVLGMVRYGYKQGLFITNAKISPPAKRDCLNNYPGYSVEFIDGWELVKRVFGNLVLKAVWYDGISLNRVSYTLIIPTVARDLDNDKPLSLLPYDKDGLQGNMLSVNRTQVQVRFQRASASAPVFGAYRSPQVRTIKELGTSHISVAEIVLSGVIYLEDIDELLPKVGSEVIRYIKGTYADKQHFAVLLGYPFLTPLGGEAAGARIELREYWPITFVNHGDIVEDELDWILPTQESGWLVPKYRQSAQSGWVRSYNPKLDICLNITIFSPASDAVKWMVEEQRDFFMKWWGESLFLLLPTTIQNTWVETKLPDPSHWYQWDSERSLGVWLHPIFNSPFRPLTVDYEEEADVASPFQPDLENIQAEINHIKTQAEELGGVVVEPTKARHMIAILDKDPFPVSDVIEYDSQHLVFEPEIIPTPINPNSRRVTFTACWLIKSSPNGDLSEAAIKESVNKLIQEDFHPFVLRIEIDDRTISKQTFLIIHIDYESGIGFGNTVSFLQDINGSLESLLLQVENALVPFFDIQRATERYWDEEILMRFK
jgi:hypothetical protein